METEAIGLITHDIVREHSRFHLLILGLLMALFKVGNITAE